MSDEFRSVQYVNEGQEVWLEVDIDLIKCVVQTAMGNTARVVNKARGIDTWARLDELRQRV